MVNSGSSANLLATFTACNPARKNRFNKSDEVIIPSLCWPTSMAISAGRFKTKICRR